jgi:hypothetical protein
VNELAVLLYLLGLSYIVEIVEGELAEDESLGL